ncbi:hypothetical protein NIES2107_12300 [Nostoc carneum NIES-2107]|nr:hypothetical protein NIES2107_12300 [Nostoc carneum NIES-2107]
MLVCELQKLVYKLQVLVCELQKLVYELQVLVCELQVLVCELQVLVCELQVLVCELQKLVYRAIAYLWGMCDRIYLVTFNNTVSRVGARHCLPLQLSVLLVSE